MPKIRRPFSNSVLPKTTGPTRGETESIPFLIITARRMKLLGVYSGAATLRLGGEHGKNIEVHAGDLIVIPAGVAHQNVGASNDFGVVGAYPGGRPWDLLRGLPGERPKNRSQYCGLANAGERSDLRSRRPITTDLEIQRRKIEIIRENGGQIVGKTHRWPFHSRTRARAE